METTRRDLVRLLGALGVTGGAPGWLTGCQRAPFDGDVVVIGAGPAGLTAGFLLQQAGVPFTVLEATGRHGGRLEKLEGFVDFPIELGAEWIHTGRRVLNQLSQTDDAHRRAVEYRPMTGGLWDGARLTRIDAEVQRWRGEYRFEDTSWFDFFDDLMAPAVVPNIRYDTPVAEIASDRDGAVVTTVGGERIAAARVIFTAPLAVLMRGDIVFDPPLSDRRIAAFDDVVMPPGLKVFIEFSERFYPHAVFFDDPPFAHREFERVYYDVALDKPGSRHVLGLYAVGTPASAYTDHATDADRIVWILAELDAIFDGAASRSYRQHHTRSWAEQPYTGGTFSMFHDWRAVKKLGEPIGDVVHFAGEAYNLRDNWGFAHLASRSAYDVVDAILGR